MKTAVGKVPSWQLMGAGCTRAWEPQALPAWLTCALVRAGSLLVRLPAGRKGTRGSRVAVREEVRERGQGPADPGEQGSTLLGRHVREATGCAASLGLGKVVLSSPQPGCHPAQHRARLGQVRLPGPEDWMSPHHPRLVHSPGLISPSSRRLTRSRADPLPPATGGHGPPGATAPTLCSRRVLCLGRPPSGPPPQSPPPGPSVRAAPPRFFQLLCA